MPAEERWVDPEQPSEDNPAYRRMSVYGDLEDVEAGKLVGVDMPTVALSTKAIVDTAIVTANVYNDDRFKAGDLLMFLVSQTQKNKNIDEYTSVELRELFESEAFQKYYTHLKSVVAGKRADTVLSVRLVGGTGVTYE